MLPLDWYPFFFFLVAADKTGDWNERGRGRTVGVGQDYGGVG